MKLKMLALVLLCGVPLSVSWAEKLQLNPNYPATYTVKKGDTLWDISGIYLKHPWLWPELWQKNQQITNPDLIYPGDQLRLYFVNGQPRLGKVGASTGSGSKREIIITPKVWSESKLNPIATLPLASIAPFLRRDYIFDTSLAVKELPYIIGNNEQPIGIIGRQPLYVQGQLEVGQIYGLYRPGERYQHGGQFLGQEAIFSGVVRAEENLSGNQALVTLLENQLEVRSGDRLLPLPAEGELNTIFTPQPAPQTVSGEVVDIPNKSSGAGKFEVVLVGSGRVEGAAPGMVAEISRRGAALVTDRHGELVYKERASLYDQFFHSQEEQLPDEVVARVMLFRTYEHLSYGLILESSDLVRRGDLLHGL